MKPHLLAMSLLLGAAACAVAAKPTLVTCPTLVNYTKDQQLLVLEELNSADIAGVKQPNIRQWLRDYSTTRDQLRTCH